MIDEIMVEGHEAGMQTLNLICLYKYKVKKVSNSNFDKTHRATKSNVKSFPSNVKFTTS